MKTIEKPISSFTFQEKDGYLFRVGQSLYYSSSKYFNFSTSKLIPKGQVLSDFLLTIK